MAIENHTHVVFDFLDSTARFIICVYSLKNLNWDFESNLCFQLQSTDRKHRRFNETGV